MSEADPDAERPIGGAAPVDHAAALSAAAERARAGNLARVGEKLARQNKLFVRDRLDLLLDEGTFVEDALLANALGEDLPADGVVTGTGEVDGRTVVVVANASLMPRSTDATVWASPPEPPSSPPQAPASRLRPASATRPLRTRACMDPPSLYRRVNFVTSHDGGHIMAPVAPPRRSPLGKTPHGSRSDATPVT